MNLFFHLRQKYYVPHPTEQVQKKLRFITNRRFEDYSIDVVGKLEPDGRFELMNKWGITNTPLIENRRAYLQGHLAHSNEGSCLEIRLRPNVIFIVSFYISLLLLVLEVYNISIIPHFSKLTKLAILGSLNLILITLIVLSVHSLKKRFEQLMQLN
jgi:hypothetical protein